MYKVDRDNGGYITTSGKIAYPARWLRWSITGYDVETGQMNFLATFESEEEALEAYNKLKAQEGAQVLTEEGLEYIVTDGHEYVLQDSDERVVYYEDCPELAAATLACDL